MGVASHPVGIASHPVGDASSLGGDASSRRHTCWPPSFEFYTPYVSAKEFWDSLPSLVQMAVFNFSKGHTAEELATISKRIMLSAIHALPEMYFRLREEIFEERNTLLMCTLYYICFDHGLPKSATALSKVSLNDKQLSIVRESVKTIIVNLVETSVTQGLDKKAEWTKQSKEIEDIEFRQTIKNALDNTKREAWTQNHSARRAKHRRHPHRRG